MDANKEEGTTVSSRLLPLSRVRRARENRGFYEEGFSTDWRRQRIKHIESRHTGKIELCSYLDAFAV